MGRRPTSIASSSRGWRRKASRPSRAADKLSLIRRATLDLTGLPPTPEEVDAFVADKSPDAFAKVVDRLLASPRYGESLGPHLARRRALRRRRLPQPRPEGRGSTRTERVSLPRLGDQRVQRRPAVRPVRPRADRRRSRSTRRRACGTCRRSGFLGLGPWFYDNGAVEVTRADERHDRVDVVCRAAFSASRSPARAATITSTTRFRRATTTRWPACS